LVIKLDDMADADPLVPAHASVRASRDLA